MDGYITIALESGTGKYHYSIFECDSFKMDDFGEMKDFAELGEEIFSWKEDGYMGMTYDRGYEYSAQYMDDIIFNTKEEAYRQMLSNIFGGW